MNKRLRLYAMGLGFAVVACAAIEAVVPVIVGTQRPAQKAKTLTRRKRALPKPADQSVASDQTTLTRSLDGLATDDTAQRNEQPGESIKADEINHEAADQLVVSDAVVTDLVVNTTTTPDDTIRAEATDPVADPNVVAVSYTTAAAVDTPIKNTAGVLHFHQGDYNDNVGFYVGLDKNTFVDPTTGKATTISDADKTFVLSRITASNSGQPIMQPMVRPMVSLNGVAKQANPLYNDVSISQLLLTAGGPVVGVDDQPENLYYLPDAQGGYQLLNNNGEIKDATKVNNLGAQFDIAVMNLDSVPTTDTTAIFVAGANDADLSKADKLSVGVTPVIIDTTPKAPQLTPQVGVQLDLGAAIGGSANAEFVDAKTNFNVGTVPSINLWWDDKTYGAHKGRLFGTLSGVAATVNPADISVGLFGGRWDGAALTLEEEIDIPKATPAGANGIFIADNTGTVNLSRPRVMHTSTAKDLLLVTGGVDLANFYGSQAWVNALPLDNTGRVAGKPAVDRAIASANIEDIYTPYIVGRHPSFLATVEGTILPAQTLTVAKDFAAGSFLFPGTLIIKGSKIPATSTITAVQNPVGATAYVKFDDTTTFNDDTKVNGKLTQNIVYQDLSEFNGPITLGPNTDVKLTSGSLEVEVNTLTAKQNSVLKTRSVLGKDTTLINDAFLDIAGTTFAKSKTPGQLYLTQDSTVDGGVYGSGAGKKKYISAQVGYGSQLAFMNDKANAIAPHVAFSGGIKAIKDLKPINGTFTVVSPTPIALTGTTVLKENSFFTAPTLSLPTATVLPLNFIFPAASIFDFGATFGAPAVGDPLLSNITFSGSDVDLFTSAARVLPFSLASTQPATVTTAFNLPDGVTITIPRTVTDVFNNINPDGITWTVGAGDFTIPTGATLTAPANQIHQFSNQTKILKNVTITSGWDAAADTNLLADVTAYAGLLKSGSTLAVNSTLAGLTAGADLTLPVKLTLANNAQFSKIAFAGNGGDFDASNQKDATDRYFLQDYFVENLPGAVYRDGVFSTAPKQLTLTKNISIGADFPFLSIQVPAGQLIKPDLPAHAATLITCGADITLPADITLDSSFPSLLKADSIIKSGSAPLVGFNVVSNLRIGDGNYNVSPNPLTVLSGLIDPAALTPVGVPLKLNDSTPSTIGVTVGAGGMLTSSAGMVPGLITPKAGSFQVGKAGTNVVNNQELVADLTCASGDQVLKKDSVVASGSLLKKGSTINAVSKAVAQGSVQLTANPAPVNWYDPAAFVVDASAAASSIVFKGNSAVAGDGQGALLSITNSLLAPADQVMFTVGAGAPPALWTLAANMTIGTDNKGGSGLTPVQLEVNGGDAKLEPGSVLVKEAYQVTGDSVYGFSATDMQVIGDSVYIALEGDRLSNNGVESGIFKSTAVFANDGSVRGWTPWRRVGGSTDAAAFFGYDESSSNVTYLTSPDGQGFIDYSGVTPKVINPATVVKLTGWSAGDDALHGGSSLGTVLQQTFAPEGANSDSFTGVYGLFNFDPDTPGFAPYTRTSQDPNFSCMVATGNQCVALAQTGVNKGAGTFVPTQKYDKTTNTFVFDGTATKPADKAAALAKLGRITCAEWTRNAGSDNYLFVGGENGLAVLCNDTDGSGVPAGLGNFDSAGFPNVGYSFVQLQDDAKTTDFTKVRKIVADQMTGYVYVTTDKNMFRINPSKNAFFTSKGALKQGNLSAGNDFVNIAKIPGSDVAKVGGAKQITDLMLLSSKADKTATTVLLGTDKGLFNSSVVNDGFDGAAATIATLAWTAAAAIPAADLNATLHLEPINLHAGGPLTLNNTGDKGTFEGNINVYATNDANDELRLYRLFAKEGNLANTAPATSKVPGGLAPYVAKLGTVEPTLLDDLDNNLFLQALDAGLLTDDNDSIVLPPLLDAPTIAAAVTAAAAGNSILDLSQTLGSAYDYSLVIPQTKAVTDTSSGAVYVPTSGGVLVNE